MESIWSEYEFQKNEVSTFLNYLEFLDIKGQRKCITVEIRGDLKEKELTSDFLSTQKASYYLILYNFIESVVSRSIDFVHKKLETENLGILDLSEQLRKVICKQMRKNLNHGLLDGMEITLDKACVRVFYKKRELINGNLDHKEIRLLSKEYGFDMSAKTDGKNLSRIKDNRNHLAHGETSFIEIGKKTSVYELKEISEEVFLFLKGYLDSLEKFVDERGYLANCG